MGKNKHEIFEMALFVDLLVGTQIIGMQHSNILKAFLIIVDRILHYSAVRALLLERMK